MDHDFLRAAFRPNQPARPGADWRTDMMVAVDCVGFAAAGFLATAVVNGLAKMAETSFSVPSALGVGLGLAAAMSLKVARDHQRALAERLDARPEYQALLQQLRVAGRGSVASRRGDAWVVFRPGHGPQVMKDSEYRAFRRAVPLLDEVVPEGDAVTVTRLSLGQPVGDVDTPATVERFDLATGRPTQRTWVIDGVPFAEDRIMWLRESRAEAAEADREDNVVQLFRR